MESLYTQLKGKGRGIPVDMPTDLQRYVDLCHDKIIDWGKSGSKGLTWKIAYFRDKRYVKWVIGVGRKSVDDTGMPKERVDTLGRVSYMGADLWNYYQYLLRMRKLEDDHMACFTGMGRSSKPTVCISSA